MQFVYGFVVLLNHKSSARFGSTASSAGSDTWYHINVTLVRLLVAVYTPASVIHSKTVSKPVVEDVKDDLKIGVFD